LFTVRFSFSTGRRETGPVLRMAAGIGSAAREAPAPAVRALDGSAVGEAGGVKGGHLRH